MSTTINDDRILDARDMQAEIDEEREGIVITATARTFPDVINQWTETLLEENRKGYDVPTLALILRLGVLGQRLIYEANDIGMRDMANTAKNALKA